MLLGNQSQFFAAKLNQHLHDLLCVIDAGNGTPVADALASALLLDMRMSGVGTGGEDTLNELSQLEIVDLAVRLLCIIDGSIKTFELPFGTKVESRRPGEFLIGGEYWLLDASRPGLHPMESMRRDAHGPNLDLLHAKIRRMTRNLACRRMGLPQAHLIIDTDDRHLIQFAPFEEAGGVVLQRWANCTTAPRFCAALPDQIDEFAKSIVADMRALWNRRKEIGERARAVRAHAERVAKLNDGSVVCVAIDLQYQQNDPTFSMYVEYEGIDEAMRTGHVLDYHPWNDVLDPEHLPNCYGFR